MCQSWRNRHQKWWLQHKQCIYASCVPFYQFYSSGTRSRLGFERASIWMNSCQTWTLAFRCRRAALGPARKWSTCSWVCRTFQVSCFWPPSFLATLTVASQSRHFSVLRLALPIFWRAYHYWSQIGYRKYSSKPPTTGCFRLQSADAW